MRCPFCADDDTRVVDSRVVGDGVQVRRRRECTQCGERFTTYERAELTLPRVIKQDGSRVPFSEDKLRAGILRALEKRTVSLDDIDTAIDRIQRLLMASGDREVGSRVIGEHVMEALKGIDQVAYVRFASVYRSFQDVADFRDEVERLENTPTPEAAKAQISLLPTDDDSA
ncbi:MAG: transcriptional regulator NrdR [Pseudomonadota bacterium]